MPSGRRSRLVVFTLLFNLAGIAAYSQTTDPFALTKPLVSQAVASCGDLTMSDGLVDSSPTNGSADLLANGAIKVTGGTVNGSATAGPGFTVTRSGSAVITGSIGTAPNAFTCAQVDLAALAATLQAANSNAQIPLTAQKKNPLASTGDFTLSGGDGIVLPAGTYYFHKFTISGGSTVTLAGPVRIFATSDVNISGGSVVGSDPWQLRFWASSAKWTLSSSTLSGFVYAPNAATTISAGHLVGGLFAGAVTISGSSHVTRALDTTAPTVVITAPLNGDVISDPSQVTVTGTATDAETAVDLQVNGQPVTIAPDGSFETTINLHGTTITAVATDAAGNSSNAKVTVIELTDLTVVPTTLTVDQNGTGQLAATASYSDGTSRDVTGSATWTSSLPGVASVAGGTVSGNGVGQAIITAALGRRTADATVTVRLVPTSLAVTPASATINAGTTQAFTATATYSDGTTANVTTTSSWSTSNPAVATIDANGVARGVNAGTATVTATFGSLSRTAQLTVVSAEPVPPDPRTLANPLDPTVVTSLADEVKFLYSGANAIQTGVVPGAITDQRVTVVRGVVRLLDGSPLPAATITALNHPEYGKTLSRADGAFDFAFNGGGSLVLVFTKSGYVPAQRRITSLWNEQKTIDDVALVPYDTQVTAIAMNVAAPQVARGSVVSDADGSRRATVIFPAGTTAQLQLSSNSFQTVTSLSVRATEFTIGPNGPKAMPALLPAMSGYTYCVEMSADEAVAAGATSIVFSNPVPFYVENFLKFPVGTIVPSGYYDRVKGAWIPSENGIVLKVVSVTNGLADIDINGDGVADNSSLSNLGIDDPERQQLATLYAPGQSLWRVPLRTFSPHDHNYPDGASLDLPDDAMDPDVLPPGWPKPTRDGCRVPGASTVDCHNQTLSESVAIVGTPFSLIYDSGRTSRLMRYSMDINVTGANIPASLERVDLTVEIAGRTSKYQYTPQANLQQSFTWDGMDVYGRTVQGARTAKVTLSYVYPGVYLAPPSLQQAFGLTSISRTPLAVARTDVSFPVSWNIPMGQMSIQNTGFGGWTLDAQKFYDGRGRVIYDGEQTRYSDPQNTGEAGLFTQAGSGKCCFEGDGGAATSANIELPISVAPTSDGGFYSTDSSKVRKVDPSGTITTVVGTSSFGSSGDGPITPSTAIFPWDVATGPGDVLYLNDQQNSRVRTVSNGFMTTVAGNGTYNPPPCGAYNGVPATSVSIAASGIAVGPDGTLYIASGGVYSVTPDGIIHTIAGTCDQKPYGAGIPGPALGASISAGSVALGPDGSIYILASFGSPQIARIWPDGMITAVTAPAGAPWHELQDGDLASTGSFPEIQNFSVAPDGSIFVVLYYGDRVRQISPNGIVTTFAGNGNSAPFGVFDTNGTLARAAYAAGIMDAHVGPDGGVFLADSFQLKIRKTQPLFPAVKAVTIVPSEDGSEVYVFDHGRHVRTVDALTNATILRFEYDANGYLTSIKDVDDNTTTIERDAAGNPIAIDAPGGQRTVLSVSGGNLSSIADPGGNTWQFTYNAAGLLEKLTDPRQRQHQYKYDASGMLVFDGDPAGGSISLNRTNTTQGFTVFRASAEGRTHSYDLAIGNDLRERRVNVGSDGLTLNENVYAGTTTVTLPDQSKISSSETADPRFGTAAPMFASATMTLPSLKAATVTHGRSVVLSDPANPLSLTSLTETFAINGRTSTMKYDASTRQATMRSAVGRTAVLTLTPKAHVESIAPTGLTPTSFTYDTLGRVQTIQSGARTYTFGYDAKNQLTSITDPLQRTVGFTYDDAGRVTIQTLPDQRTIGFSYDENGNVTSVTPPGRPRHGFTFTPVDLEASYTPPTVQNGGATQYAYNKDRQLTLVTRPDSSTISLGYDTAGRLSTLATPTTTYTYGYNATKGTLTSITTSDGNAINYGYDGSLLTSATWSGGVAGSIGYTYDNDFRVSTETVGSSTISFGYDDDSLLTAAGALTISRSPQTGFVTGTTLNSVSDSWTYNGFGEPLTYSASYNGGPYFSESYSRDNAGRIATLTQTLLGTTWNTDYGYDDAGRLTMVTRDGTVTAMYGYDSNGNRLTKSVPHVSDETGSYDDQDRMLTYNGAVYSYTPNGELQQKVDASGTTTYTYDALGNLRHVVLPDGRVIDYVIDAQNRRVGKKVNGTLVQGWLYADQLRIVAELDGSGNVVSRFVYGTRSNVPDYMIKGGQTYRIISDHLGSPRLVVNVATGAIAESLAYDEFGVVTGDTAPGFQPFGFAGGLYDATSQLLRFGVRDYDPFAGRWQSQEPSAFAGGLNLYGYAVSDPQTFIDRDGRFPVPVATAIIGAAAGAVGSALGQISSNLLAGHSMFHCFSGTDVAIAAGFGAVGGALAPITAVTMGGAIATAAVVNIAQYAYTEAFHGRETDVPGYATSGIVGAGAGIIGGKFVPIPQKTLIETVPEQVNRIVKSIGPGGVARNFVAGYVTNSTCGCE